MFSFEGDLKRTHKVSLGGASKKEQKASLLHRKQEERRKREDERKRLKKAIIIQSYIRGFQERKRQYGIQRSHFNRCVCESQCSSISTLPDCSLLPLLIRCLLFFYHNSKDTPRLIWLCQNVVKHHAQFVKLLAGPERNTCRTYLPPLQDNSATAALIEQVLHYMVHSFIHLLPLIRTTSGYYRMLYVLANHKLPSSLDYSDAPLLPLAHALLEHTHRLPDMFSAFTEDFISPPFSEQMFHFFVPALADRRHGFPFQDFLFSLQAAISLLDQAQCHAPWLFYFVLSLGEMGLGSLSEEGLLLYLSSLQALLSLLPVSESDTRDDVARDSEDEDNNSTQPPPVQHDNRMSVQLITQLCLQKLDSELQTNTLLSLEFIHSFIFYRLSELFSGHGELGFASHLQACLGDACLNHCAVIANLVKILKAMDISRLFCPKRHWLSNEVNIWPDKVPQLYDVWRMGQSTLNARSVLGERYRAILTELSFVVPFEERVKIVQRLVYADKWDLRRNNLSCDQIRITIRRNCIYRDAYNKLSKENEPNLNMPVLVHMLNTLGLDEAGMDGGVIFREFFSELLKSGFNPNQGFFRTTNEGLLYPSPMAEMLLGESFTRHFLGRILGKPLYENMLLEMPFASFFLSKLLGTSADMYRNLLFLKSYEGDVEDLGLNFTIVNNDLGEAQIIYISLSVVELKPGGKDIPVTKANRIAYILLVADYWLNKQIRAHCLAFRQGLANVLNLEWLRMFDQQEIQVLLNRAHTHTHTHTAFLFSTRNLIYQKSSIHFESFFVCVHVLTDLICLDDLKKFTNYSGGYSPNHPVIKIFWDVVENFSEEEKHKLLKFVTSCSRPPLLGFKELVPSFTIHNKGKDLGSHL
ncbi:hypothetical protein Q7C36_001874 [Tachysurus vachellii]|uniref:HECT-type E3 ubiquitin transferase n=1 Tax=Tachysurus vachellii TaxID=175792 RepID=A0AA88T6U3_TACVA|nr:hypothetical protein Q7C36_001874 [Tachysurus vachellii]